MEYPTAPHNQNSGDLAATFCATIVNEWVELGVSDAVVCPGSRSTPMAVALAKNSNITVHVAHDERSGAFMALGFAQVFRLPVPVVSTSGTAAVNFHPAVVEADLSAVPLMVVTADRPPELHGVLAPQTIDQRELFGKSVRWYCEPGPPAEQAGNASQQWWREMARDAFQRTQGGLPGPVHMNLAFRDPLVGTSSQIPPRPEQPKSELVQWSLPEEELAGIQQALASAKGVIVAGARAAVGSERDELLNLASRLGWPILADASSGLRMSHPAVITTFDSILRSEPMADTLSPDVVLRFGGLLASKVTNQWLARSQARQFAFDRYGRSPDPERVVSKSFPVAPAELAQALAGADLPQPPDDWSKSWMRAEAAARRAIRVSLVGIGELTEPAVAIDVMAAIPPGGNLVVSSSMPVRDLEWFAEARGDVTCFSNRGANGIDGVTSTAIGVAAASGAPTVLITGDIAFLHDSSALIALRERDLDLTIVVIHNDGGGIFSFLPQAEELDSQMFEKLFSTPHGTDLGLIAQAHGLQVEQVQTRAGLQAELAGALRRGGTRVVVGRSDRNRNVQTHAVLNAAVMRALEADTV